MKNSVVSIVAAWLIIFVPFVCPGQDRSLSDIKQILRAHCLKCHGKTKAESGLNLESVGGDFSDRNNAAIWLEIRNQVNLGEMPPQDEPPLTTAEIKAVSTWISRNLKVAEQNLLGAKGKVVMRRMNRHEYTHTISDLLYLKFPSGESPLDLLPPDGKALGFDKVSAALTLDPSLLQMYYKAARQITARAIVDGPPKYPTEKMRLEYEDIADSNAIGYLLNRLGMKAVPGGIQLVEGSTRSFGMLRYPGRRDHNVAPQNGFYRFTVRAGGAKGENGEVPRLLLTNSHPDDKMKKIMEFDVKAPWDSPKNYSKIVPRDTLGSEFQLQLVNQKGFYMSQRPGEHFMRRINEVGKNNFKESIKLTGRKIAEGWGGDRSTPDPDKLDETKYPRVFLDYLEVEGPLYDQWPPKSHTSLLFKPENATQDMGYAREIFSRFLPRAWRRPVGESELDTILNLVQSEMENGGSFIDGIQLGLTAALTSPNFLYLVEPGISEKPRSLNDYELASRLSYFLWSSMPDDELFKLAKNGKLGRPSQLSAQVDRMFKDPRISRFVEGFGRQWLKTDTINAFMPDQYLYRSYDENLSQAVEAEPIEFLRTVVLNDLSALNFIDSEFVVVNRRLAQHYKIDGVDDERFQKVELPDGSFRGGLLAMAGVHQAGSDGVRTKPVARAAYVLEVLFNDPPDPPPPNAGEIEPNIRGEKLTVRQRLLQHQQIKSCAACHSALDPYGLAMENFNVIGDWRESQDGENFRGDRRPKIVIEGKLPNGKSFSSFAEFRTLLFQQKDRFRRALAEKLLVYALGRPVEPTDDPLLTQAVQSMATGGDTFKSLIKSIVTSRIFQEK